MTMRGHTLLGTPATEHGMSAGKNGRIHQLAHTDFTLHVQCHLSRFLGLGTLI